MPSPFPGMDPWLERPREFRDLRFALTVLVSGQLNGILPRPYFADIALHGEIDKPGEPIPRFCHVMRMDGNVDRPCTYIEIVCPWNKSPDYPGFAAYRKAQASSLAAGISLVEIDLIRGGTQITAMPRGFAGAAPDYHVCVNSFDHGQDYATYQIRLQDRLPKIVIPLLPADGGVSLDLQDALDRAYDAGPYRRRTRYAEYQPDPPLTPEQQIWAADCLRAAGLVPAK